MKIYMGYVPNTDCAMQSAKKIGDQKIRLLNSSTDLSNLITEAEGSDGTCHNIHVLDLLIKRLKRFRQILIRRVLIYTVNIRLKYIMIQ